MKKAAVGQSAQEELSERLKKWSLKTGDEILGELDSREEGLTPVEADERLTKYGRNVIESGQQRGFWKILASVLINPFNLVLLVVLAVTFLTDVVFSAEKSYSASILILSTITISTIVGYSQEAKSNNAAAKLRKMIENKVDVIRNGLPESILLENVVPGDIVKLSSGDMLPGDVRFLAVKDLFVDQATLTGESAPVEKLSVNEKTDYLTDLADIGFMGTNITSGSATAVVLTTGAETYFGGMAKSLSTDNETSDFENGIAGISKLLIRFMLVMVPVIFFANLMTKSNVVDAVLFSITVSIGLIPEMLPVIMTTTLARGAVEMSKKKTIVKRLSSIQTFGQMDILCTDKTGTLTQDEIVLEKYLNVDGEEDMGVLKQAFVNSFFQSGLKNTIDNAVIGRVDKEGLAEYKNDYREVDEIPFDFARRRMSVVVEKPSEPQSGRILVTKGAAEEVLSCCSYAMHGGSRVPMTDEEKKQALGVYDRFSDQGLRMLAVAEKWNVPGSGDFDVKDECDMTLIGFIGFLDPPKESAKGALDALHAHGIRTVVLTGDAPGVARYVCEKMDIDTRRVLSGAEVESMSDDELQKAVEDCSLFAKLNPYQKKRVVSMLQKNGHTVGYMGDGINDAPPLKQANVGISVDSAVDIAKEVADIILLDKDLSVLDEGVTGGRKTYANLSKYIKMATSGNFGNMFSVVLASIFLPFLPLLPEHILVQNLLNDFAQLGMPWDNVDPVYLQKPKKINTSGLRTYMFWFGLASTVEDLLCFLILWFVFRYTTQEKAVWFQTGWFLFGTVSQTFIIHIIRTEKIPFLQDKASRALCISTAIIIGVALLIGFTSLSQFFEMAVMPPAYLLWLLVLLAVYTLIVQILKPLYVKKYGSWI
ncbi:MAG: magnesium-translocating P-type ATPase [Lachnospiraceae bacterium]|jgi:Mg2+-importing ATPase|nr:magnesium-translocating P-type ATPase [Lachnospiraceae bacterium]